MKEVQEIINKFSIDTKYIIYGIGNIALECAKCIKEANRMLSAYVISQKNDTENYENNVLDVNELSLLEDKNQYIYILASRSNGLVMKRKLEQIGINEKRIMLLKDYYSYKAIDNKDKVYKSVAFWPPINLKNADIVFNKIAHFWISEDFEKIFLYYNTISELDELKRKSEFNSSIIFADSSLMQNCDVTLVWDEKYIDDVIGRDEVYCVEEKEGRLHNCVHIFTLLACRSIGGVYRKKQLEVEMENAWRQFENDSRKKEEALLVGLGPSITKWIEENRTKWDTYHSFACNSWYLCDESDKVIPDVYCIMDIMFFVKTNILSEIIAYVKKYNCILVTNEEYADYIYKMYHYKTIIGLSMNYQNENEFCVNRKSRERIDGKGTVMLNIELPLAASYHKQVNIIGCDGSEPNQHDKQWKHAHGQENMETNELTLKHGHGIQYNLICNAWKEMIELGQKHGCRFTSFTSSHIEALKKIQQHVDSK